MPMATTTTTRIQAVVPNCPRPRRLVAFTTPPAYSPRLSSLLSVRGGAEPLSVPTISVDPTPHAFLQHHAANGSSLDSFAGIAFTSRTGIHSFSLALDLDLDLLRLSPSGGPPSFFLAALGKDADLLYGEDGLAAKLLACDDPTRIRILVPDVASPAGLVKSLGFGYGKKILCPVPTVVDLTEPPVIPDFLKDLEEAGWVPVRVSAYETRWIGPKCVERLVALDKDLDAIIFTSTAEVEGLIMGLKELGWDWDMVRRRWPNMVVGAHGPVTAKGAERYGIDVDVVSEKFSSFDGVLDALDLRWSSSR
ncbi:uncharacterized protein M6B38_322755 [Iris pallida]|uniref:Tetrapyrrole biosynthesis uroporphyrinogen III synthase domain-containing protein n=1 Tax=Iris pallida TaxID=29817 RepID=A0AAX6HA86_IRIPA|nr:uncharacterized protein M6B38_322755 [Iris pallida]